MLYFPCIMTKYTGDGNDQGRKERKKTIKDERKGGKRSRTKGKGERGTIKDEREGRRTIRTKRMDERKKKNRKPPVTHEKK